MKKMIIILSLILLTADLIAPPYESLAILKGAVITPYERIWNAVCEVESGFNPLAYNASEKAYGIAQIREVRLRDYNIRFKKKVPQIALFDVNTSKVIFMAYASQHRPGDIKGICISWNGKSERNLYYKKIKALL